MLFLILICSLQRRRREREGGWGERAALTRVLQAENQIGDDGAGGLGEGLKVNSNLKKLYLVSHSVFDIGLLVAKAMQAEGADGCSVDVMFLLVCSYLNCVARSMRLAHVLFCEHVEISYRWNLLAATGGVVLRATVGATCPSLLPKSLCAEHKAFFRL
jgi:hypothetical protein